MEGNELYTPMTHLRQKLVSTCILTAVVAVALFMVPTSARADTTSDIASTILTKIFQFQLYVSTQAVALCSMLLTYVVNLKLDVNLPAIQESWKITRNFANMFFILVMIVMAFATIFDIGDWFGWAGYDVNSLVARFIVTALLINFSLVIGGIIIDTAQTVDGVFLAAIGNISNRLGQSLVQSTNVTDTQIAQNLAQKGISYLSALGDAALLITPVGIPILVGKKIAGAFLGIGTDASDIRGIAQLFFSGGFQLILAFSLLVALVVSVARIFVIWILLILAPLAWLSRILPATRKMHSEWWQKFIGWNLFLPIFLFVLYLGFYFLSQQNSVLNSLSSAVSQGTTSTFGAGIQGLFFYVMAAFILIGGTAMAMKASIFAGTGVVGVANWGRDTIKQTFGLSAAQKALEMKVGEVREEGLQGRVGQFLYGGARGERLRTAGFARALGVRGADREVMKAITDSKDTLKKEGRSITDLQEIAKGGGPQALAAGELLLENGDLSPNEMTGLYRRYASDVSPAAGAGARDRIEKQLGEQAEKGRIRPGQADTLYNLFTQLYPDETKRGVQIDKLVGRMAKKDVVTASELQAYQEFNIGKPLKDHSAPTDIQKEEKLQEQINKLPAKDLVEQSGGVFKDNRFKNALEKLVQTNRISTDRASKILQQDMGADKLKFFSGVIGGVTGQGTQRYDTT